MEEHTDNDYMPEPNGGRQDVRIAHLERAVETLQQETRALREAVTESQYRWRTALTAPRALAVAISLVATVLGGAWALQRLTAPPVAPAASVYAPMPWQLRIEEIRRAIRTLPADPAYWTTGGPPRVSELERRLPRLAPLTRGEVRLAWELETQP